MTVVREIAIGTILAVVAFVLTLLTPAPLWVAITLAVFVVAVAAVVLVLTKSRQPSATGHSPQGTSGLSMRDTKGTTFGSIRIRNVDNAMSDERGEGNSFGSIEIDGPDR